MMVYGTSAKKRGALKISIGSTHETCSFWIPLSNIWIHLGPIHVDLSFLYSKSFITGFYTVAFEPNSFVTTMFMGKTELCPLYHFQRSWT